MCAKLKALVGLEKFWVVVFSIVQEMITQKFHFPKHGYICKSQIPSYLFGYMTKIDNSELKIVTSKQFHVSQKNSDLSFFPLHKSNNSDFTWVFWVITMARHSIIWHIEHSSKTQKFCPWHKSIKPNRKISTQKWRIDASMCIVPK